MWTKENRGRYDRSKLRYPSDLTDEEWALIGPIIPAAKRGGNKRTVDERAVVNGVMYILSTGCQWASLPKDLPPRSTVNGYFRRWDDDGTLDRIHHTLYVECRERADQGGQPDRRHHRQMGSRGQRHHLRGMSEDACRGIELTVHAQ
ncbi:MAG: transposase [Alphaproteobacteria bacterium]|nr:transposase [Alphaproteobacteria bacterium]